MKKAVFEKFAIFTGKVAGLQVSSFIKKRLQHKFFPVNIANFFKSTYFEKHLGVAASEGGLITEIELLSFNI